MQANEAAKSPGVVARNAAIALGIAALLYFAWLSRAILITLFLGVLFSIPLSAGASWMVDRWHFKRPLAVLTLVLLTLGLLAGLGAFLAPTLREQGQELREQLPKVAQTLERWTGGAGAQLPSQAVGSGQQQGQSQTPAQHQQAGKKEPPKGESPGTKPSEGNPPGPEEGEKKMPSALRQILGRELGAIAQILFPFVSGVLSAITGIIMILFTAIYLAIAPQTYVRGAVLLFPVHRRDGARETMHDLGDSLMRWLVARLIAMVAIGLITAGGLALLQVKSATALGVFAGVMEFVPFFGPIIAAIPAIGVGLVESPGKAMAVAALFLVIQQLEGNVITPLLLQKRVDVPAAMTISAVALLGVIFGVLGVLIAEPLVVAILVVAKHLVPGAADETPQET